VVGDKEKEEEKEEEKKRKRAVEEVPADYYIHYMCPRTTKLLLHY
jgi:hypothetical protein